MTSGNIMSVSPLTVVKASYWFPDGETPVFGDSSHAVTDHNSARNIDSKCFTHLFCAFADINPNTHEVCIDKHWDLFHSFTATVKEKKQTVHTLLSIGGKNDENTALIKAMARDKTLRKSFIDSSIKTARECGFGGLDLAWEYPSTKVDMDNLAVLLGEWRSAIDKESETTEEKTLLLTAAVFYSSRYTPSVCYPVEEINKYLDWVNVIAYDFYQPGSSEVTGPPAAMFDPSAGPSIISGLKQWFDDKLEKNKVVLGLPYVGWAWTLKDDKDNGYDAATKGPALSPDGSINYDQVKKYILDQGAATVHNPMVTGDYCYAGQTWIAYDDNQSIVNKVRYAKETSLLGYYGWHIGADIDCGLSRAAWRIWDATEVPTETATEE